MAAPPPPHNQHPHHHHHHHHHHHQHQHHHMSSTRFNPPPPPPPPAAAATTLQARLHNFVKYALLQQLVPPGATVCDLYCGRGADTEKWAKAQIGLYIGIDLDALSLEEAQEQWNMYNRPFPAEFFEVDPSMENLETELRYAGLPADFVTCMGQLQDCFSEESSVKSLLLNVASILKPGGYFFGITADSSTIWSKYQKVVESAHRHGSLRVIPRVHSEYYIISFEDDRFTPFGTRYTLQFADGVIAESQHLIHFPSLIRLAEEVGLEYIELQNLQEFYDDYRIQLSDILRATCSNLVDPKGKLPQFAHDILSLYTTFIFKKTDPYSFDFVMSPLVPMDEELENYPEESVIDDSKSNHFSPAGEHVTARRVSVEVSIRTEVKEEDCNVFPSAEGNGQDVNSSILYSKTDKREKEDITLDVKASRSKMNNIDGLFIESEDRVSYKSLNSTDLGMGNGRCKDMESRDETAIEPDFKSPTGDKRTYSGLADEVRNLQLYPEMGDDAIRQQKDGVNKEKEEVALEQQSDIPKMEEQHRLPCHSEGLSTQDTCVMDYASEEQNDLQRTIMTEGEATKNEINLKEDNNTKKRLTETDTEPRIPSEKTNLHSKEEISNRSGSLSDQQQRYRMGPPPIKTHNLHSSASYSEREFLQGSRHKPHGSHGLKIPRERVGDHRAEHVTPRGDNHRTRARGGAHNAPTFVPFVHFIPQTEFPVFQSPNTPGLLGPGPVPPTIIIPEPIGAFWPIHPLERRIPHKSRGSRKQATETSTNRARKESPKKNAKDSPPPGTQS